MAFDIPRDAMTPVARVELDRDPAPHPFEAANRPEIDRNWAVEHAANPALFDGRMMLFSELSLRGDVLAGRCHEVRYATLLYWRKYPGMALAEHAFAHAALVARDGALVAIRMGRHTANPDGVYFAAGSFEREDFAGGRCDLPRNMAREVGEETGLDIAGLRQDPYYVLFSRNHSTAIFRRYWLDDDAETVAGKIRAFVAAETDPEIEGPVIISAGEPLPAGIKPHMAAFCDWHFGRPQITAIDAPSGDPISNRDSP